MNRDALEVAFVRGAVSLACAIVICFGIVGTGFLVDRMSHAEFQRVGHARFTEGFWFCLNATFGNGCWAP